MRLTVFNRTKYVEALNKLKAKNAPAYVIEAYNEGFSDVINAYYKIKLDRRLKNNYKYSLNEAKQYAEKAKEIPFNFLKEAISKMDADFLKAFFQMTNLDIVTGEKLPPNAGKLIRTGMSLRGKSLKDLYKKLR